jgi:hypothetical protein
MQVSQLNIAYKGEAPQTRAKLVFDSYKVWFMVGSHYS